VDKDIDIWKQRNEILHKKVNRQMEEIKELNKKSETIFDLARRFPNKTYVELEKYRDADRVEEAIGIGHNQPPKEKGVCVTGALRKDLVGYREYQKERKLRQEAEGELSILKGIETNRVKESEIRCNHLQDELDRVKKENNDLFLRIAELTEVEESHRKMNGKLQERLTEVEEENKKLNEHVDKQVTGARESGM
jgi:cell division protein FtsB